MALRNKKYQERGDICVLRADSLSCIAETQDCKAVILQLKKTNTGLGQENDARVASFLQPSSLETQVYHIAVGPELLKKTVEATSSLSGQG